MVSVSELNVLISYNFNLLCGDGTINDGDGKGDDGNVNKRKIIQL